MELIRGVFNRVNGVLHIKYMDRGTERTREIERYREKGRGKEKERGKGMKAEWLQTETCGAMRVSLMRLLITVHCH